VLHFVRISAKTYLSMVSIMVQQICCVAAIRLVTVMHAAAEQRTGCNTAVIW